MKLKKSFWANLAAIILLTSCVSKPIPIIGDSQKTRENLYNEYMVIADSYFELEKYDKAITYYKMCMEKKSLYWASYYKLAKAYALQSNWNEAAQMYKVILSRDPDNYSIKSSLAYIYAMQGNTEVALSMYNELMQYQPESQEYLENYIAVQILSKDLTDVEAPIACLIRDFPDSENIAKFQSQIDLIIAEKEEEKLEKNKDKKDDEEKEDSEVTEGTEEGIEELPPENQEEVTNNESVEDVFEVEP